MNFWKEEGRHVNGDTTKTDNQRQDVCQHFVGTPYCISLNFGAKLFISIQILVNQLLLAHVLAN
jgi:hypothetical protein